MNRHFNPFCRFDDQSQDGFVWLLEKMHREEMTLPYFDYGFANHLSVDGVRRYVSIIRHILLNGLSGDRDILSQLIEIAGLGPRQIEAGSLGLIARLAELTKEEAEEILVGFESFPPEGRCGERREEVLSLNSVLFWKGRVRALQKGRVSERSAGLAGMHLRLKEKALTLSQALGPPTPIPLKLLESILPAGYGTILSRAFRALNESGWTSDVAEVFFEFYQVFCPRLVPHIIPALLSFTLSETGSSDYEKRLARVLLCVCPGRTDRAALEEALGANRKQFRELVTDLIALVHLEVAEEVVSPALTVPPHFYFHWSVLPPAEMDNRCEGNLQPALRSPSPGLLPSPNIINIGADWSEVEEILLEECNQFQFLDESMLHRSPELVSCLRPTVFATLIPRLLEIVRERQERESYWFYALRDRLKWRRGNIPYLLATPPRLREEITRFMPLHNHEFDGLEDLYHVHFWNDWWSREKSSMVFTDLDVAFWRQSPASDFKSKEGEYRIELEQVNADVSPYLIDHLRRLTDAEALPLAWEVLEILRPSALAKVLPLLCSSLLKESLEDRVALAYVLDYLDPVVGSTLKLRQWESLEASVVQGVAQFLRDTLRIRPVYPVDGLLRPDWRMVLYWQVD